MERLSIMAEEYILEAKNIHKSFGSTIALSGINFNLKKGEIHAILGENGAGKSTLVKIFAGIHFKNKGNIYIDGKEANILNPQNANKLGIFHIPQEIQLINDISVAENIFINSLYEKNGFINWNKINQEAKKICSEIEFEIDVRQRVKNLSIGEKQIIQVARAIHHNIKILIMDEPTSSLNEEETKNLFKLLKRLNKKGVSVIYISHKLNEVLEISDRITIYRDGKNIGTLMSDRKNLNEIIMMMIGKPYESLFIRKKAILGDLNLELKGINKKGVLHDISFKLYSGEILGITGLLGSGTEEIANLLFGLNKKPADSGDILVYGKKVVIHNSRIAINNKIGLVPGDRNKYGLFKNLNVLENMLIANLDIWNRIGFIEITKSRKIVESFIKKLNITARSIDISIKTLSGGNQQKVVLAKWLTTKSKILVLHEPTFGVDIGAKSDIYSIIDRLTKEGCSILLISSDIQEILGMSDRIICMYEGRISGEIERKEANENIVRMYCNGINMERY